MSTEIKQFHFSIGPVQQFIAQARRTRDFWAGSFLLSWLAGVAMLAAQKQGATVQFPIPEQSYLDWLEGNKNDHAPVQGSIPNRFMATLTADDFDGDIVVQAVKQAWIALADLIWEKDFDFKVSKLTAEQQKNAKEIWQRQHENFWEMMWVVADSNETSALDVRKNWRHFIPSTEPGQKCHLMEGWQELSGVPGVRADDQKARKLFWNTLALGKERGDFPENEHICAIAYVKRRFVRFFREFNTTIDLGHVGTFDLKGWHVPANRPSVVYIAAVHWLNALLKESIAQNRIAPLKELRDLALELFDQDEGKNGIACLESTAKALNESTNSTLGSQLIAFNSMLFFENFCIQEAKNQPKAEAFCRLLRELCKELKLTQLSPTPFYAVLTMDGDQLGIHMSDANKQQSIANALNTFTAQARKTVEKYNGSLVYAGGDDVMAVLSLEDALPCAEALKEDYLNAFKSHPTKEGNEVIPSTLSGAIVYAHVKSPLTEVLRQSHEVLDKIAKEKHDRNALAIRVLKPGGVNLTWGLKWNENPVKNLSAIATAFGESPDEGFSSRFFYSIRSHFDLINEYKDVEHQTCLDLIRVHFLSTMQGKKAYPERLHDEQLKAERVKWVNDKLEDLFKVVYVDKTFSADALMLVRFLASKGVESR